MYNVVIERTAEKDLLRLQKKTLTDVIIKIRSLSQNPRPVGSKKLQGSHNDWRIRVGDYRILYEIADKEKEVRVMKVRHRKEVYR